MARNTIEAGGGLKNALMLQWPENIFYWRVGYRKGELPE